MLRTRRPQAWPSLPLSQPPRPPLANTHVSLQTPLLDMTTEAAYIYIYILHTQTHTQTHTHMYIYIQRERERERERERDAGIHTHT